MSRARLTAAVGGAAVVGLLLTYVPQFEGTRLKAYTDPIGIVTACTGHTATAELGRTYTREECEKLLMEDLAVHAEGVMACVNRGLNVGQRAAAVSFAFNVGVSKFCGSTIARKLREGDESACAELSKWVYAGGRELPGLVKRRAIERAMCEGEIGQ